MNTPTSSEQRCHDRQSLNRSIYLSSDNQDKIELKMVDISTCGIGLLSPKQITTEENVSLEFSLPVYDQNTIVKIAGKIVRATPVNRQYLLGVEFQNPTPHDILVIKEFFNFHRRFNA